MSDFTWREEPLFDRSGKQVGVDRIRRYVNPPAPLDIQEGKVHVKCACGAEFPNVDPAKWDAWPSAVQFIDGQCNCKSHFLGN